MTLPSIGLGLQHNFDKPAQFNNIVFMLFT